MKIGRKQRHFEDPKSGNPVVGLSRMTDGRWRIIGTQTRFSEDDPARAIEKFYKLTGQKRLDGLGLSDDGKAYLMMPAALVVQANAATANPYRVGSCYHAVVEALRNLGMNKMHSFEKIVPEVKDEMNAAKTFGSFKNKKKRNENGLNADARIIQNISVCSR
jgi:hypothetical protein